MSSQYIKHPTALGSCVHSSRRWQVTAMARGLGAELLLKRRAVSAATARKRNLDLHDCYPSIFFQGEAADELLATLEKAQEKLTTAEIDRLVLDQYLSVQAFARA